MNAESYPNPPRLGNSPVTDSTSKPTDEQFNSALDVLRELAEDARDENVRFQAASFIVNAGNSQKR